MTTLHDINDIDGSIGEVVRETISGNSDAFTLEDGELRFTGDGEFAEHEVDVEVLDTEDSGSEVVIEFPEHDIKAKEESSGKKQKSLSKRAYDGFMGLSIEKKAHVFLDLIQFPVFLVFFYLVLQGQISVHFLLGLGVLNIVRVEVTRIREKGIYYFDSFNIKWPSLRGLGLMVLAGILMYVVNIGVSLVYQVAGGDTGDASHIISSGFSPKTSMVLIAGYVVAMLFVIVPFEEIVFRHLLQRRLLRGNAHRRVWIASSIFAVLHVPFYLLSPGEINISGTIIAVIIITLTAVIFGYLYERTDNLTLPILLHTFMNVFSILSLTVF